MADIIEKLAEIPQLYHAQGCTDSQIADAEQTLGITFPEEFKTYVKRMAPSVSMQPNGPD